MTLDPATRSLASQVVYQIFPDRFAPGGGNAAPAGQLRGWDESTLHQPYARQFFGGDLDGITGHLDYLADLGVTAVYLTPVFTAPSNHKYDATDLDAIDPMFGGEAALLRLLAALHGRGMKLVMDTVLNHVSDQHPWFRAARAGDPAFRDFFTFLPDGDYLCWKGHAHMPELNLANGALRDRLYRRPDSVVQRWLGRGVDGWRFDVAQDVGLEVADELGELVRARFPEAWLIGEIFGFGGAWLKGGRGYHGTMNYYFGTALLAWLKGDLARFGPGAPIVVFTHRPLFDLKPEWEWYTGDGDAVMNLLAPFANVTVLYGHIHRHHEHEQGHARHFAARSLIFGFPDPAATEDKKPEPFDPARPFKDLGLRRLDLTRQGRQPALAITEVELSLREFSGTVGINQILKGVDIA